MLRDSHSTATNGHKRAAIYCRVSTTEQKDRGFGLPAQITACRDYAREQGYTIVAEPYTDDFTGMSLERPELDRLRGDIRAQGISVVVCYDLDRLARKALYQELIEMEIEELGATVEYVRGRYDESDEGALHKGMMRQVAEYARKQMLRRTRAGTIEKVKTGSVIVSNHAPYGYRVIRSEAEKKHATLEIMPEQAEIIRMIFEWYIYGDGSGKPLTVYEITRRLNEAKIAPPFNNSATGMWGTSTIGRILERETYGGIWHYDKKVATGKKGSTGKPKSKARERSEWIAVTVPAIISTETFAQARERAAHNRKFSPRNRKRLYLFAGMITCKRCGRVIFGTARHEYHYYRCFKNTASMFDQRCELPQMAEKKLVAKIWPWVYEVLRDPEAVIAALEAQQARDQEETAHLRARLDLLTEKIAKCDRELKRALDIYAQQDDMPDDLAQQWLKERKSTILKDRRDAEAEQQRIAAELQTATLTPQDRASIEGRCADLRERAERADTPTPEDMRATFEDLRLTIAADVENGEWIAHVRCVLGEKKLSIVSRSAPCPPPTTSRRATA